MKHSKMQAFKDDVFHLRVSSCISQCIDVVKKTIPQLNPISTELSDEHCNWFAVAIS